MLNKKLLAVFIILSLITFTSCSAAVMDTERRQEASSYEEKTVDAKSSLQLGIDCDYAEIEAYSWDREQVKFEITRRLRGNSSKEKLTDKLDKLEAKINAKKNNITISGSCRLQGAAYPDCCLEIRIYTPRKINNIDCRLKSGRIKFFDNIRCNVNFDLKNANLEINSLEGKISFKADSGAVRISSGKLENGSTIQMGKGNVNIKASCVEGGEYSVNTQNGIIKLELPAELNAAFEYPGSDQAAEADYNTRPAKFRLKSGVGKIEIIRT